MNDPRPIPTEDLALYAMQALSADEMDAVAAVLRESPEARQELARIQGDLALLSLSSEQQQPPAGAFDRLKARMAENGPSTVVAPATAEHLVSRTPVVPSSVDSPAYRSEADNADKTDKLMEMPRRSKWSIVTPWAIAAALAIATIIVGVRASALNDALNDQVKLVANLAAKASRAQQVLEVLNAPNAQRVTLTSAKTPPVPTAHTVYLPERGALVMQASNLKQIPAGKTYELWVIPANGSAPVPAGTFSPDAQGFASLVLPKLPTGVPAKAFGITVENSGGATTPTAPILLSGE